jgi:hypothetical protein
MCFQTVHLLSSNIQKLFEFYTQQVMQNMITTDNIAKFNFLKKVSQKATLYKLLNMLRKIINFLGVFLKSTLLVMLFTGLVFHTDGRCQDRCVAIYEK